MDTVAREDDAGRSGGRSAVARGDKPGLADADLIRLLGAELYGVPVADMMSAGMGINRRTVQRWLSKDSKPLR